MFVRITLSIIISQLFLASAHATQLSKTKRALIDEMLVINGTANLVPLMSAKLTREIIMSLSQKNGPVDKRFVSIVHAEVKTIMYEEFVLSNKLNDIFYSLYDEFFSEQQMRELVNFYSSATGKRASQFLPELSKRSMEQAKEHARLIGSKVQARMIDKFDEIQLEVDEFNGKQDVDKKQKPLKTESPEKAEDRWSS